MWIPAMRADCTHTSARSRVLTSGMSSELRNLYAMKGTPPDRVVGVTPPCTKKLVRAVASISSQQAAQSPVIGEGRDVLEGIDERRTQRRRRFALRCSMVSPVAGSNFS
jgi:hypothetical protein